MPETTMHDTTPRFLVVPDKGAPRFEYYLQSFPAECTVYDLFLHRWSRDGREWIEIKIKD